MNPAPPQNQSPSAVRTPRRRCHHRRSCPVGRWRWQGFLVASVPCARSSYTSVRYLDDGPDRSMVRLSATLLLRCTSSPVVARRHVPPWPLPPLHPLLCVMPPPTGPVVVLHSPILILVLPFLPASQVWSSAPALALC